MLWIWLAAAIIFAVLEAATVGLTSIWFTFGALAALVVSLLHGGEWVQILTFVVCSGGALFLTRPLAKKYVNEKKKATNADRVLEMFGYVTEEINNIQSKGAVNIGGKEWSARSECGEIIPVGTLVKPLQIDGVKLIVQPTKEQETVPGK